jgi:hypothetical protein
LGLRSHQIVIVQNNCYASRKGSHAARKCGGKPEAKQTSWKQIKETKRGMNNVKEGPARYSPAAKK